MIEIDFSQSNWDPILDTAKADEGYIMSQSELLLTESLMTV